MKSYYLRGGIALAVILLVELNFFLKVQPFEKFYFPIVWVAYIFLVDAIAESKRGKSFILSNPLTTLAMFIISVPFWHLFEYINLRLQNWSYIGTEFFGSYKDVFAALSFSTVIPAFFLTLFLFYPFSREKLVAKKSLPRNRTNLFVLVGILLLLLPLIWPRYFFPVIWAFLIFLLDPLNYNLGQPSILRAYERNDKRFFVSVAITSLVLGFFWEFWNFWASVKWVYSVPFVGFAKIFEMPLLGYLGYVPFGFSIFAFYFFVEGIFRQKWG
ncbi:hypothetical protein D6817_03560 [Candidatus Pacearchaeota archaeon]|nr:MAG: hypothetical protein D6817_03560 [Candidatus Pacearchaeota archaeon]